MESGWKRHTLNILTLVIVILTLPLTLSLLLPLYTYRVLVKKLSRIFRKDLDKMLNTRGTLFARDYPKMFQSGTRCGIHVTLVLNGTIPLESVRQLFWEKCVDVRRPQSRELIYPEMRQTLTSWLGFIFWQWDKNFSIQNHVKMYEGPGKVNQVGIRDMLDINKELLQRAFTPGQSPWEVWLWHNSRLIEQDSRPKTILMYRIFHSAADGFSILKLLTDLSTSKMVSSVPKPVARHDNNKPRFWEWVLLPIQIPYEFIDTLIHTKDSNPWHPPEYQLKGKMNGIISDKIPVTFIKEIKNMYGTSFQVVLLAAFTGGLRNFMIDQGMDIPKEMHCQIPLPFSTHPDKIRNHMTVVLFPLPLRVSDPGERLALLDKSLRDLSKSTVPLSLFYLFPLLGALPLWLMKMIPFNENATCVMSNFPGPANQMMILDHPVEDMTFGAGLLIGNTGVGAASLTYNGQCRFMMGVDEAILSREEHVQDLMTKMTQELCVLKGGQEVV